MSYFGISGPAQDGGFVQGIHLGAARLHNARIDRQRHAKALRGFKAFGAPGDVNEAIMPAEEFIRTYGSLITPYRRTADKLRAPYYIGINDVYGPQVSRLLQDAYVTELEFARREYAQETRQNIETYAFRSAKNRVRDDTIIPMFEAAGYPNTREDQRATILGQSAVNRGGVGLLDRLKVNTIDTMQTVVYDPSDNDAVAEGVVKDGSPQNTTQIVLYTGVAVGLAYYYMRSRRPRKTGKRGARKDAKYAVFS